MAPADAAQAVTAYAAAHGASRRVDAEALAKFLADA